MKISNLFESTDVIDLGNYVATGEEFPNRTNLFRLRIYLKQSNQHAAKFVDSLSVIDGITELPHNYVGVIFFPFITYTKSPTSSSVYYFEPTNTNAGAEKLQITSFIASAKIYGGMLCAAALADQSSSELLGNDDFQDAMYDLKSGMAEASVELEKYFNRKVIWGDKWNERSVSNLLVQIVHNTLKD